MAHGDTTPNAENNTRRRVTRPHKSALLSRHMRQRKTSDISETRGGCVREAREARVERDNERKRKTQLRHGEMRKMKVQKTL
jgi:hypothetical protein